MNRTDPFRMALVQMDPCLGAVAANADGIARWMAAAAEGGAQLVIFPECALSGYVYESVEEVGAAGLTRHSPLLESLHEEASRLGLDAVIGLLEREETTGVLYNSAVLIGKSGPTAWYRKCHLPVLGIDRYVGRGESLPIFDLPYARIGVLICYDVRFPEATRSLALNGADLLVVPTNWPVGAESAPEFLTRARAWENRIYVAACNRVGTERGTRFIGRSHVVAPDGTFLVQAEGDSEIILYADIDVDQARQKKIVFEPGVFELDPVGGRRPELYGDLVRQ